MSHSHFLERDGYVQVKVTALCSPMLMVSMVLDSRAEGAPVKVADGHCTKNNNYIFLINFILLMFR